MAFGRVPPNLGWAGAGSPVASLSAALAVDAIGGDMIVVGVAARPEAASPVIGGVVDDQGNTYNRDAIGLGVNVTSQERVALFSQGNIGGGPLTVTYTPGSSMALVIIVQEYYGLSVAGPTGSGGSDTDSSAPDSGVTDTPSQSGMAVAMLGADGTAFPTTDAPFTYVLITGNVNIAAGMADRSVTVLDPQQCVWTLTDVKWDACIAIYYAGQPVEGETRGFSLGQGEDIAGRYPDDLEV
jgi:hypothetical protein